MVENFKTNFVPENGTRARGRGISGNPPYQEHPAEGDSTRQVDDQVETQPVVPSPSAATDTTSTVGSGGSKERNPSNAYVNEDRSNWVAMAISNEELSRNIPFENAMQKVSSYLFSEDANQDTTSSSPKGEAVELLETIIRSKLTNQVVLSCSKALGKFNFSILREKNIGEVVGIIDQITLDDLGSEDHERQMIAVALKDILVEEDQGLLNFAKGLLAMQIILEDQIEYLHEQVDQEAQKHLAEGSPDGLGRRAVSTDKSSQIVEDEYESGVTRNLAIQEVPEVLVAYKKNYPHLANALLFTQLADDYYPQRDFQYPEYGDVNHASEEELLLEKISLRVFSVLLTAYINSVSRLDGERTDLVKNLASMVYNDSTMALVKAKKKI